MRTNSLNDEGKTLLKSIYRSSLLLILTVMLFFLPTSHAAFADDRPASVVDYQVECVPWQKTTFKVVIKSGITYQVKVVRIEDNTEKGVSILYDNDTHETSPLPRAV